MLKDTGMGNSFAKHHLNKLFSDLASIAPQERSGWDNPEGKNYDSADGWCAGNVYFTAKSESGTVHFKLTGPKKTEFG